MSIRANKPTKWIAGATLLAVVAVGGYAVGAGGKPSTVLAAADLKWEPYAPGVPLQVAKLWGDRTKGAYGMLLKLPAGFEAGVHAHTADYKAVVVAGTWFHTDEGQAIAGSKELPPGSFAIQPGKAMHNDRCKEGTDCILFIMQDAKGDFIPGPAAAAPKK
jgi:anti-sigma factor ChrR (cupin superfamily)